MSKLKWKDVVVILGIICVSAICYFVFLDNKSETEIKQDARRSSVQINHYIPVLKASFTKPLEDTKFVTTANINKFINKKIEELKINGLKEDIDSKINKALIAEREFQAENKYNSYITKFTKRGYIPISPTFIPLGAIVPDKYYKFPTKVLTVVELKDNNIDALKNKKDILTISELANVSPSVAKNIIYRLQSAGYTVYKSSQDFGKEIKLLWFDNGWDDTYPYELKWSVTLGDSDENILIGYDAFTNVLITKPIPKNTSVVVNAGYFRMKDEFIPKTREVKKLNNEINDLKNELKEKEKEFKEEAEKYKEEINKLKGKEGLKRDISKANMFDVMVGNVKLEQFWMMSTASGIFLGNMAVRKNKVDGYQGAQHHILLDQEKGFILTNDHVARSGLSFTTHITNDNEIMWIVFPGSAYVRYTRNSDTIGSPAQVLTVDYKPVSSPDFDCAIMTTTKVYGFEDYKVELGNSDNVKIGEKVIMVGNPTFMQKFLTEGVVSNTNYSILDSVMPMSMSRNRQRRMFLRNSNFWFDTPIGVGGTSGSGVWVMEGKEKGKVVAIHNMGLRTPLAISTVNNKGKIVEKSVIKQFDVDRKIVDIDKDSVFKDYDFKSAEFNFDIKDFEENNIGFKATMKKVGLWADIAGMNAGVPINKIKIFLQESGINPNKFAFEKSDADYWLE